jgi:hypothetical protein
MDAGFAVVSPLEAELAADLSRHTEHARMASLMIDLVSD